MTQPPLRDATEAASVRGPDRLRVGTAVAMVLWFGPVSGLAETILSIRRAHMTGFAQFGLQQYWMAPLADTLILALLGLLTYPVLRRIRRPLAVSAALGLFAFFMFFSISLHVATHVHPVAKVMLAAGMAAAFARLVSRPKLHIGAAITYTAPLTVAIALGVAGYGQWSLYARDAAVLNALPPAAHNGPNVLLIVLDTVRADHMSLYGYTRRTTPFLDALAGESVVFNHAVSTAPWTLPSHASILTGEWASDTGADWWRPIRGTHYSLSDECDSRGYFTSGFVGNTTYLAAHFGVARGFSHYEDYPCSWSELARNSSVARYVYSLTPVRSALGDDELGRKGAQGVTASFLSWVDHHRERPFFTLLNYFDAHSPYLPPAPYGSMFGSSRSLEGFNTALRTKEESLSRHDVTDAELQAAEASYDGAIRLLDDQIAAIIEGLEKRELLDSTIVVVTADHGEQFGEHGLLLHGNSLYEPLLHVPLLIRFPSAIPAGRRIGGTVSLRDLPATLVDLAGWGVTPRFAGRSLRRCWSQVGAPQGPVLSEVSYAWNLPSWFPVSRGDMASLYIGPYHYIANGDGVEELYEWHTDPLNEHDLADRGDMAATMSAAREMLHGLRSEERAGAAEGR